MVFCARARANFRVMCEKLSFWGGANREKREEKTSIPFDPIKVLQIF